ncbi:hypothetical protein [Tsuneonella dongtanensis]|nr:hypothetical protein [Tsuneonella dongtanensis]
MVLAACSQENAPSEAISKAADKVVEQVQAPPPKLAKGPYAPRDECGDVKGAAEFRAALARAVSTRDTDALIALAAKDVELDFGGGSGTAELRKRLADPTYDLWDELATLVTLGCAKSEVGGITLPWYFAQDFGELDVLNSIIVMGEDVPLRETADASGKVIAPISWDAVTLVGSFKPDAAFHQVKTSDGKVGFIEADKLRPIAGYRLLASSRDGKWSFTTLIAGD